MNHHNFPNLTSNKIDSKLGSTFDPIAPLWDNNKLKDLDTPTCATLTKEYHLERPVIIKTKIKIKAKANNYRLKTFIMKLTTISHQIGDILTIQKNVLCCMSMYV